MKNYKPYSIVIEPKCPKQKQTQEEKLSIGCIVVNTELRETYYNIHITTIKAVSLRPVS